VSAYFSGVIISLLVFATTRVIAGVLGLEKKALKIGYWLPRIIAKKYRPPIVSTACALLSLVSLTLWLSLNVDDRIRNWWIDPPPIGSFPIAGQLTARTEVGPGVKAMRRVELAVPLRNNNVRTLRFDATLRATVNGKDLEKPIIFTGFAAGGEVTQLLVVMSDVPLNEIDSGMMKVLAEMRYDVVYRFADAPGTRRTSKLVRWEATAPTHGEPLLERRMEILTRYLDAIEE